MRKILVLAELKDGKLRNVSYETLTAARQIADGGEVISCLFGSDAERHVSQLGEYGADKIYIATDEQLDRYTTDAYSQALLQVIREVQPAVVLTGHTSAGKDLMPRIAARLGAGLVSDCTNIELADGEIVFTRPIYAGKAFQKRRMSGTVLATIRPNNIAAEGEAAAAEIIKMEMELKDLRTVVKEVVRKTASGVDLTEAKIVVSGGRGVKSEEGFQPLRELADVLGAAVGASRGACDAGYCDYAMQVGQTGKVVTPDLYIACGISGAIQHLAGMSNSKIIVAINKDPEANIFQVADYGIVGDLFEVVPRLTEEFKKIMSE